MCFYGQFKRISLTFTTVKNVSNTNCREKNTPLIEFGCVMNSMFVTGDACLRVEGTIPSTFF
jgi:hypothetical protein